MLHRYETQGAEIYRQSFATIRREAELSRFTAVEERVVVRMIHAAGMVELAPLVAFSPGMADAARQALQDGAPVLCDVRMVSEGITRTRLPAHATSMGQALLAQLSQNEFDRFMKETKLEPLTPKTLTSRETLLAPWLPAACRVTIEGAICDQWTMLHTAMKTMARAAKIKGPFERR